MDLLSGRWDEVLSWLTTRGDRTGHREKRSVHGLQRRLDGTCGYSSICPKPPFNYRKYQKGWTYFFLIYLLLLLLYIYNIQLYIYYKIHSIYYVHYIYSMSSRTRYACKCAHSINTSCQSWSWFTPWFILQCGGPWLLSLCTGPIHHYTYIYHFTSCKWT